MMRWGNSGQAADSFYQVRPDCSQNVPSTKFKIKAGKTLSVRKWHAAFTREGCLDIASVLSRIQRGVWFLALLTPIHLDLNRLSTSVCLYLCTRVSTLPSGGRFGSSCLAAMILGAPSMSGTRLGTGEDAVC